MTDLADLVEPLKREVAIPGEANFVASFPETSDDDLIGTLADGFAEAQLDGILLGVSLDLNTGLTTPDLSLGAQALVVLYSGTRIVRNQIRNTATHVKYEAAGNIYERDQGATLLKEVLVDLTTRKQNLLNQLTTGHGTSVYMRDGYMVRALAFYEYELTGAGEFFNSELANPYTVTDPHWGIDQAAEQINTAGVP